MACVAVLYVGAAATPSRWLPGFLGSGLWALGSGLWALGSGLWALGSGLWALGFGGWTSGCGLSNKFVGGSRYRVPGNAGNSVPLPQG